MNKSSKQFIEDYKRRVRCCQRVSWYESGISLRGGTWKRNKPRKVSGYAVWRTSDTVGLISDYVLADDIALLGLAHQSEREGRLVAFLVRRPEEISPK